MSDYKTPEELYLAEHGQPGKDHKAEHDRQSNTATDDHKQSPPPRQAPKK